ncbi:MAG TPA: hypothetical protein VGG06_19240 [Thermoanaerobaculia bacterium]
MKLPFVLATFSGDPATSHGSELYRMGELDPLRLTAESVVAGWPSRM